MKVPVEADCLKTEWWKKFGKLPKASVRFSVDGHRETNNLYRVGSKFDKILENMKIQIKNIIKFLFLFK